MDGDYLYFRQTIRFTVQHDLENGTIYVEYVLPYKRTLH